MKKLFIVLAISSVGFVACNNSAEGDQTGDTTAVAPTEVAPPPVENPDTLVNLDTNTVAPVTPEVDSTKK